MHVSAVNANLYTAAAALTQTALGVGAVTPAKPVASSTSTATSSNSSGGGATASTPTVTLYTSPTQIFDPATGQLVVETLNTLTGAIETQTPSKAALQYERTQMLAAQGSATRGAKLAAAA